MPRTPHFPLDPEELGAGRAARLERYGMLFKQAGIKAE